MRVSENQGPSFSPQNSRALFLQGLQKGAFNFGNPDMGVVSDAGTSIGRSGSPCRVGQRF